MTTTGERRRSGTVIGLVLAAVLLLGIGVAAAARFAFGDDGPAVADASSYRLDHDCTVEGTVMTIAGSLSDLSGRERQLRLAVAVLAPDDEEAVMTATIDLVVPPDGSTPFDRLLADYESASRSVRVDDSHSCSVEVLETGA